MVRVGFLVAVERAKIDYLLERWEEWGSEYKGKFQF